MTYFKNDLIKNFGNITGKSFEDSASTLNNSNTSSSHSMHFNVKEYHNTAVNNGASSESVINSLGEIMGRSYENIRTGINMIPLKPFSR